MKKWCYASMLAALICLPVTATEATGDGAVADAVVADAVTAETVAPEIAPVREPAALEPGSAPTVEGTEALGLELEGTVEATPASSSGRIICTFNCNNGIGVLYDCPLGGLGLCCGQAEPACASRGGLESGICRQGRLGLPCTPL